MLLCSYYILGAVASVDCAEEVGYSAGEGTAVDTFLVCFGGLSGLAERKMFKGDMMGVNS